MDATRSCLRSVTRTSMLACQDDAEEGGQDRKPMVSEICGTYMYMWHRAAPQSSATPADDRNQERSQICDTFTCSALFHDDAEESDHDREPMVSEICDTYRYMCHRAAPPTSATPGHGRNQDRSEICDTYAFSFLSRMMLRRRIVIATPYGIRDLCHL